MTGTSQVTSVSQVFVLFNSTHLHPAIIIFLFYICIDDVTLKERVLMIGGAGLAIVVFFLIGLMAGALIHHRGWQKGWEAAKRS